VIDFFSALPAEIYESLHLNVVVDAVHRILPFSHIGLGWVCPALLGLLIGFVIYFARGEHRAAA